MPSFKHLPTITLALLLALGVNYALAYSTWVGPTADAPGNNVDAPLNISSTAQTKTGALSIANLFDAEGLLVDGNSIFHGSVQIEDGTEGLDKVLASDAEGNAAWTDINDLIGDGAGGGGGSGSGVCYQGTVQPGGTSVISAPGCLDGEGLCTLSLSRSNGDWGGGNSHITALFVGKPNGNWELLSNPGFTGTQAGAYGNTSDASITRFFDVAGSCFLDESGTPGSFRVTAIPASVTPCSVLVCPVN